MTTLSAFALFTTQYIFQSSINVPEWLICCLYSFLFLIAMKIKIIHKGTDMYIMIHLCIIIRARKIHSSTHIYECHTVELWSLELACLEHQGSLELVGRSRQFPYTLNVKIHPRLEQRWLELSNSTNGPQGDFSCKNAMMARTKYFFT